MQLSDSAATTSGARRCAVCQTGRRWREFQLVEAADREPMLLCPACRARHASVPSPSPVAEPAPSSSAQPSEPRPVPSEDRLKKALRELPAGEYAVAQVAKAAGLNHDKTLRRLRALQDAGEIQQVGNRWSNRPPATDLDAAMDRLRAQTSNLRIVEPRSN